jgi:hypothetical protein
MNIARGQRAIWPGGTYMSFLRDFFVGYQPTVDDAFRKAKQIGWTVEASEDGEWDDPTGEKKQEIREYRTETYYEEEYKPGWKRWLGF